MGRSVRSYLKILKRKSGLKTYRRNRLLQIAFPLGGIGAGCINLNGYGGLQDFSIYNRPALSAGADSSTWDAAAFAVLHLPGENLTRLVEGPLPAEKVYNLGLRSHGYRGGGHEGLPRFRDCAFRGEYPFGQVMLSDPAIPLRVEMTAFNPFIPLDDVNSGIPCAILEYCLINSSDRLVGYQFSYHLSHLAPGSDPSGVGGRSETIPGAGVYFYNVEKTGSPAFGSAALGVIGREPLVKTMWYRGRGFDALSVLWRELSTGRFEPDDGDRPAGLAGRNGGSILLAGQLEPGGRTTFPVVIAWHFPNVDYSIGQKKDGASKSIQGYAEHGPEKCCQTGTAESQAEWHPYYTNHWTDARDMLLYINREYDSLRRRTQAFHTALFASTLPKEVLEAVSVNLAIIKSPTVLRGENGLLWGWEGCWTDRGCCHGTCTHVWNYAVAIAYLFPQLERMLREQELVNSMDEQGHINFRAALPAGPTDHSFHAAADGQLGGILKVYRDWQTSGDREWLKALYPLVVRSMAYCMRTWDPRGRGVLEEPHHNTYDIEFWGPDGLCMGFYLAGLTAMAAMAREIGRPEEAAAYEDLMNRGRRFMDEELFNGEYYEQKVMADGLEASFTDQPAQASSRDPFELRLLASEGPKYQYGPGCLSDSLLGVWLADLYGLPCPLNRAHVRRNLRAIFDHNFKNSLWDHANTQRPGFAVGDESGLLLCTWPRGRKPTLPFVYSDEVWTGIEYQAASHMIAEGLVEEGLKIVRGVRSRYDGHTRNPWNEYECGNYYARAMSSYGLLAAISGFRYSAPERRLKLSPKITQNPFIIFFCTAGGYGMITLSGRKLEIAVAEGSLAVDRLEIDLHGKIFDLTLEAKATPGQPIIIRLNTPRGKSGKTTMR